MGLEGNCSAVSTCSDTLVLGILKPPRITKPGAFPIGDCSWPFPSGDPWLISPRALPPSRINDEAVVGLLPGGFTSVRYLLFLAIDVSDVPGRSVGRSVV